MNFCCHVLARPEEMGEAQRQAESLRCATGLRCESLLSTSVTDDLAGAHAALLCADQSSLQFALSYCAEAQRRAPGCALLILAESLSEADLIALLSAGAADFVRRPVDIGELATRLRRIAGLLPIAPMADVRELLDPRLGDFIGNSDVFLREVAKLPTVAGCDSGVLILGETGTGKEVCARAIHYMSARASKPWVAVNCGAIPTDLIESELFGHVKGAYTNALNARSGLVREAEGGSLFLDEIDALPLAAQSKLLRFLQEREYRPVGSNTLMRANVRVMAASNRNLQELVTRGTFRQDVYFRLNVLNVTMPPLRDRRDDIAALALHFAREFAARFQRAVNGITPQALQKLRSHDWPGNVRELQHVIERAVLLAKAGSLGCDDLRLDSSGDAAAAHESLRVAKARMVENFERSYIEQTLAVYAGNVTHAARAAQKNRRAFFQLMRKYQIDPTQFRAADE